MPLAYSQMIALGTIAPDFKLWDTVSGNFYSLNDFDINAPLVIIFSCNHCPYVLFINEKLVELANKYMLLGVNLLLISSNDVNKYPQDSPENMKLFAAKHNYKFAYLYDETQAVALDYAAACTPDIYVFGKGRKLAYRGQFCSARPSNGQAPTGDDLAAALNNLLAGKQVDSKQYPSAGCSIKWKP